MKDTVCAVVVTYNRKQLLIECLESLRKQTRPVQGIYLIDNASTDGTPDLLLEKGYINELPPKSLNEPWEKEFEIKNLTDGNPIRLHYVRMHENTGGAGGFHEGVKRAYEKRYDWLWLMDDDAEPKEDALEILSLYFKEDNVVGLAGSVILPDGNISTYHRGKINLRDIFPAIQIPLNLMEYQKKAVEIDMASFVGLLIKREAISIIGFPKKEFFIYQDDVEYCIRLRTVGKILLIPESIIVHKEASKIVEKSFLGKRSKRIEFSKFWLSYYGMRNLVWLGKQYCENKLLFYIQMLKSLVRHILGIIIYDEHKYKRIKLVLSAYFDGLKGEFDNSKPKRILYEE
ncbi:MAG: glycosyltransferase family 2 protein [Sulfurihydrogenibium sp.]|uniref:glycosyltransferase family 2 protein n=1 Tax=Sulfurihydrogenibium sp. TaxID=2053621 RepID=UPI003D123494